MPEKEDLTEALDFVTERFVDILDERDKALEGLVEAHVRLSMLADFIERVRKFEEISGEGSILGDLYGGFGESLEMILEGEIEYGN